MTARRADWRPAMAIACTVAAMACAGGDRADDRRSADAGQRLGSCEVTITGETTTRIDAPGDLSSVATDYWLTRDEVRRFWDSVANDEDPDIRAANPRAFVRERMLANPLVIALGLACKDGHGAVLLVPGAGSRYEHVPFAPRSYEIAPAPGVRDAAMGTFVALVQLPTGQDWAQYVVYQPGTLDITTFDANRVAGTFAFKAGSRTRRKVDVQGRFDYRRPEPR